MRTDFEARQSAAEYLRKLPINIMASEMALRWLSKIAVKNRYTVPAVILLCWRFTSNMIPECAEAVLGRGNVFCAEQWRVFAAMNFTVSNVGKCVLCSPKAQTAKHQKVIIFNLLCGDHHHLSLMRRQRLATAAGEIVARGRLCA